MLELYISQNKNTTNEAYGKYYPRVTKGTVLFCLTDSADGATGQTGRTVPFVSLLFFGHVFPIAAGHVLKLFAGIHALTDADGLEIGAPQVLEKLVIAAEDLVVEFAVSQAEGYGSLILEGDADDRLSIIIETVMTLGIVDEPRLVVEAVAEMVGDEGQHIVIGTDDGQVGAVFGLLKTDELLHAQLFVEHATGDIGDLEHIGVGEMLRDISLTEYLTDVLEQWCGELGEFRQPTDGDEFHGFTRQVFFQPCPHTLCLLFIGGHMIGVFA